MQLSHNNNKVLPTECEILQLTVNRKLIFGMKRSIKQPRKDVGRSQTVTTPTQASKSSQKMSRQRPMWTKPTQRRDWSDVTGPPRGDPTLHLTFISSQITWVWLSLGFAQRGARESSTTTLTCIVGVSLGFGEGHVRPVGWDKYSHTPCQTWERTVFTAKHTPICRASCAQRDLSENRLRDRWSRLLYSLCAQNDMLLYSKSQQEFTFFSLLCGWCSHTEQIVQAEWLRVLLKCPYSMAKASVTFEMQDNLSNQQASLPDTYKVDNEGNQFT